MYSACCELLCRTVYFIKKTEQSEAILQHSTRLSSSQAAVRYSAVRCFVNPEPLNLEPLNGYNYLSLQL